MVNEGQMMRLASYLAVIPRLPPERATSDEMAALLHLHGSQIRRDLNKVGVAGRQGQGYKLSDMEAKLRVVLAPFWDTILEEARVERRTAMWILDTNPPTKES